MGKYRKKSCGRKYSYLLNLDGSTREFKNHRILPRPEDQEKLPSCLAHAAVNSLEARIRHKRRKSGAIDNTPRLSIQHCVDSLMNPNSPGLNFKTTLSFLIEKGVTPAEAYPYTGGVHLNKFKQGTVFKFQSYMRFRNNCSVLGSGVAEIRRCVDDGGPVIGAYVERTSHENPDGMLTAKGGELGKHAILIVGHDMKWNKSKAAYTGHWVFMNSKGPNWRDKGFYKISVDAVHSYAVGTVDLDSCESFRVEDTKSA